MTDDKVKEVCLQMYQMLKRKNGGVDYVQARRFDEQKYGQFRDASNDAQVCHCAWLLEEIPGLLEQGRREKAMRWLGWVQGVFALTVCSIEELKRMNMSEDSESYEASRV